jgi:formylglycine-generating enzyme required for sulfatase activity
MEEMSNNHRRHGLGSLTFAVLGMGMSAVAATGTSGEFRMDLSGMGPWEMRTARASEVISYSSAWATNALTGANAVVKVWPVKREKPKYIAIDLSGGTTATHYPIEYLDEIPGGSWGDEYKTSKLVLRHIPAGSFIMGGRATDYPGAVNTNLHMVTLTKDFYMGVFEVTQRQWELVMGNRPSAFTNESCYATRPVEQVSYRDIRGWVKGITWPESKEVDESSFIGQLRKKVGFTAFDLPTEAQWQYACRAGTTTALSSGQNLSSMSNAVELAEIARYAFNSGWAIDTYLSIADGYRWTDYNCTTDKGTAAVGAYQQNPFGLYDMHGNVCEIALDVFTNYLTQVVNPVGAPSASSNRRVYCCGCWRFPAFSSSAGRHQGDDLAYYSRAFSCGFRLCLQGGELPDLDGGTVLVNVAGAGAANWMPTKAGTYYLTHETQTNGVNGAEVLGAWFTVDAPELTFTPDGDLVPGVKIAIGGAGEGWTVRYEVSSGGQGAARPTGASPEYTGPITLNDSQTIRAIAISDGGLESREFSATYSLMSIGSAVAKPRYPWNGKVDIDCEVKGDANRQYLISLEAIDLDGSTNLPVRMVVGRGAPTAPQSQASEFDFGGRGATALPPGTYRFTWDADADIAGDFDFANVAVKVSAEGSAIIAAKKVLPLEVAGYTGTETLTNVPVLVRLSTAISGFGYTDFADANGGDMVFCDEGESVIYPHEIDEWHVGGESLVWVKLPTMVNGTKFKMAYGGGRGATALPSGNGRAASPLAAAVWSDYAGVWHMNEDSGTAFDSTAHGLDALPSNGTNDTSAAMAQMVAYENGACGRARVNGLHKTRPGNYMTIASYDGLRLKNVFCFSGWFCGEGYVIGTTPTRYISRKSNANDAGWEICCYNYNYAPNVLSGGAAGDANTNLVRFVSGLQKESWSYLTACYHGNSLSIYTNGVVAAVGNIDPVSDNGLELILGSGFRGWGPSFLGQYDEIRLRGGSLSADRIKADYDMIKNRNFLTYGPVESGKGASE